MSTHEWRPLGFWRSLAFFRPRHRAAASWRHFGWELQIEKTKGSLDLWFHRIGEDD